MKYLCGHECETSSVPIKYQYDSESDKISGGRIIFTLICVATELFKITPSHLKICNPQTANVRPVFPQSDVLVKFVQETGEKCSENVAKKLQIFVLLFPGKMSARNFTKNPRHFAHCTK